MDDDLEERLENLLAASARLNESLRQDSERSQAASTPLHGQDDTLETQHSIEENNRRIEETNRLIDAKLQESGELVQQLLQAVGPLQAEIVRIDQTHGP